MYWQLISINTIVKGVYEKQALNSRKYNREVHNAIWAFSQTHSMHGEEGIESIKVNMQATL